VHDTLGNALVVEVEDLLSEVEVFERRRPARADAQGVLVVVDGRALAGGERWPSIARRLVQVATRPTLG
jgi:hypothetical protein